MFQIQHILLPTDFSVRSAGMSNYVSLLASHFHPRVTILHVAPHPLREPPPGSAEGSEIWEGDEGRKAALERFAAHMPQHPPAALVTRYGEPADEIISYASAEHVDLIAMATHGCGHFRQVLLGSVAAKVLHDAVCPVLTGVHLETPPATEQAAFRRILCAVDLSPGSTKILDCAAQLARKFDARLEVTYVVEISDARLGLNFGADWEEGMIRTGRDNLHDLLQKENVTGDVFVKMGEPTERISHLAGTIHSDLLVIGRSKPDKLGGRLPTRTYDLIRRSPCPVLSV